MPALCVVRAVARILHEDAGQNAGSLEGQRRNANVWQLLLPPAMGPCANLPCEGVGVGVGVLEWCKGVWVT